MNNTLNVIFDSRRNERYDLLVSEFKKCKVEKFVIWPCIIIPDVVASINLSHKMVVKEAKELGLEYCILAEDDLEFTCVDSWRYFIDNIPASFDLYLACTYLMPLSNNKICGFHLYIVHSKFYDKFLSVPDHLHIDTAMDDLGGDYHICYPFPAIQRPGWSACWESRGGDGLSEAERDRTRACA